MRDRDDVVERLGAEEAGALLLYYYYYFDKEGGDRDDVVGRLGGEGGGALEEGEDLAEVRRVVVLHL